MHADHMPVANHDITMLPLNKPVRKKFKMYAKKPEDSLKNFDPDI